jgi:hypothetical protein
MFDNVDKALLCKAVGTQRDFVRKNLGDTTRIESVRNAMLFKKVGAFILDCLHQPEDIEDAGMELHKTRAVSASVCSMI